MENIKGNLNRRSFLKSSLMAGGGLMISFSVLPELELQKRQKFESTGRLE
jgi:hypothetical protein